jgi:hypothetical protein
MLRTKFNFIQHMKTQENETHSPQKSCDWDPDFRKKRDKDFKEAIITTLMN